MKNCLKFNLIIFLSIISCKSNSDTGFPNYEKTRKIEINLNPQAESALNEITKIIDGRPLISLNENYTNLALANNCEIYFNLNENDENIYIRHTYYKDRALINVSHYDDYRLPINEIDPSNIIVSEGYFPAFGGEYASIRISAMYNNPDIFERCRTRFNNQEKTVNCINQSYVDLLLKVEVAHEFKKQLIIFVNNFNIETGLIKNELNVLDNNSNSVELELSDVESTKSEYLKEGKKLQNDEKLISSSNLQYISKAELFQKTINDANKIILNNSIVDTSYVDVFEVIDINHKKIKYGNYIFSLNDITVKYNFKNIPNIKGNHRIDIDCSNNDNCIFNTLTNESIFGVGNALKSQESCVALVNELSKLIQL